MSESTQGKAPDISRIISVLMENPELIEQISALVSETPKEEPKEVEEITAEEVASPVSATPIYQNIRGRREQLLSALKPYLSDERQRAIDSMMTFADILDAVRRK